MSKQAATNLRNAPKPVNATPEITEGQTGRNGQVLGEPVKRTRKPRDPNAPKPVKRAPKTLDSEMRALRNKYMPDVLKQREALHALDVKRTEVVEKLDAQRTELAKTLADTEARLARIISVLGDPDEPGPDSPGAPGQEAPAAPPEGGAEDPRFIPPPALDPNNQ